MRMLYSIFILILFLIPGHASFTKPVTPETAKSMANQYLMNQNAGCDNFVFQSPILQKFEGITLYYTFNFETGFIIIAGDDRMFPILAWSYEGRFDPNLIPPALQFWMKTYEARIIDLIKNPAGSPTRADPNWAGILSGSSANQKVFSEASPLILTSWGQGCYYNSALPVDSAGPCNHPYTGCVATALAQVLKYYNYPLQGNGSNGIYSPYGWLEVNFSQAQYDWPAMQYLLNNENPTVAELLYHCTVAVNSQFFPGGTGAYDSDARNALVDYFGFSEIAQLLWRDSYAGNWQDLLRDEIDQNRPVIYGGVDQSTMAGHTFICDGYSGDSFFHFNWGWEGIYNGYYYLDSLMVGNHHFDYQHDAVVQIKPDLSGIIELYPPENLTCQADQNIVTVIWEPPSITGSLELMGYHVFRNNELLGNQIITGNAYTDQNVPAGNHTFRVQAVYSGSGNNPSVSCEVNVNRIKENQQAYFEIYPNPTSRECTIRFADIPSDPVSISLFNLAGQTVFEKKYPVRSDRIFLKEKFSAGTYLLKVSSDEFSVTRRIIIICD